MDEKAIARLLITDWALGLRITTVPQAMHRLGIADDLERRWEIADRMDALWHSALKAPEKLQEVNLAIGRISEEEQAGLAESWPEQVASWDRASILLTDNEKLIARQILYRQKASSNLPSPDDISAAVGIEPEETANGIKMLSWLGFLTLPDGEPADSYTLADGHARFLDGLGFSFHTVTLDDDEQFGIPWAIDFLLLVNSQYKEHRIKLDDACAHCAERIHLEADRGNVTNIYPKDAVVHRGGTWGQNNLFRSEEHLKEWSGSEPLDPDTWILASESIETIRGR